MWYWSWWQW